MSLMSPIHADTTAPLSDPGTGTRPVRVCASCVLPETFPGIKFDEQGVCQYCRDYRPAEENEEAKAEYRRKFEELIPDAVGRGAAYDVILAYSGGKDSTYTLHIFRSIYNLRILAVTLDNGFISPAALENMRRVTGNLGVDHYLVRPNPKSLFRAFRASIDRDLYPTAMLTRASSICNSCISVVKGVILRTAVEKNIPFVGWGWSPGQAPVSSSVMRVNPRLARMNQKALFDPLYKVAGDDIRPYFLEDFHYGDPERFPWNIHPLAFLDYNEERIVEAIRAFGWEKPIDTDPNSTNCLLNALGNKVHLERHGFHPYALEIAGLVRSGALSREDALAKLAPADNPDIIAYIEKTLASAG